MNALSRLRTFQMRYWFDEIWVKVKDSQDFERFEQMNLKHLLGYEKVDLNVLKILTVSVYETMKCFQINVLRGIGLNLNTQNLLTVTCNLSKLNKNINKIFLPYFTFVATVEKTAALFPLPNENKTNEILAP